MRGLVVAAMALFATVAPAQTFDPRRLKDGVAGGPNEVLVLGSSHLSELPAAFAPAHLAPVLDRLAAWKPQVITIEAVPGAQCEYLIRYKAIYPDTADQYCPDTAPARAATGLDVPAATAEAERLLAAWPAAPTPAQRRHLAAVFLAGGDPSSAYVQWLRLPAGERHAGDGIDATLATYLDARGTRRNENVLIAAVLAARLGLERVFPVDDHSSDSVIVDSPAYEAAIKRIWAEKSGPRLAEIKAVEAKLGTPASTLALYRFDNEPRQAMLAFDGDFGVALKDRTPELHGRHYADWWQVRNLRMVANIVAAMATRPGGRVLAIVGASHKGYFEAYLDMMHDVRIADAEAVLR